MTLPAHFLRAARRWAAAASTALILLAGVSSTQAQAQETLTVAGFSAAPGDKALVTTRRMKKRPQTERLGLEIVSVTTYEVEVLEKLDTGYAIRWSPIDTRLEGAPPELEKRLMETLGDSIVAFEFESDPRGAPKRIRDREAVENRLFEAIGALAGDQSGDARKAVRQMMSSMSDEAFAGVLAKDAALLAAAQHPEPRQAGEETSAEIRPNPFGGAPIEAEKRVEIGPSEHDGLARYDWTVDFDEAAVKASVAAMLRKMAESMNRPTEEVDREIDAIDITFEEKAEALIGATDGWTRALTFERRLVGQLPGQTRDQSERVEIALTRAEK